MRVTDIKPFVVDCFRTNFVFVKIYTDEGITGIGEGTLEYKEKAEQRKKELLALPLESVTFNKKLIPASGDIHDYISRGRYWWPNPDTPNGLPYIRRDGHSNPEVALGDNPKLARLHLNLRKLGHYYYCTRDPEIAAQAVAMLRCWFIDPATRMNPNMRYSQEIPGVCDGRIDTGLIDSYQLISVLDAVYMLGDAPELTTEDRAALLEREVAAARKKQKRMEDLRGKRDEEMAKKIQREKEERDREREERDQLKLIQTVRQVKKDREEMIADKKLRLLEEARQEREMHRKVMEANEIAREKARKAWEAKVELDNQYRRELGEEVEREWERKRIDPMAKVREGEEIKRSNDAYLARIEGLRQKKLNELRAKGVPEKYLVDIMANRFEIK